MRALRETVLLYVAVLLAGCFPPTEEMVAPPCPGASVHVNAGTQPILDWPPICGVAILEVSAVNDRTDIKWRIATATQLPDILAPVTYGQLPAGLNQDAPAVPLVSGTEYRMNLLVWVDGVASTIASVRFIQP
jgi:hypothetical protein